MHVASLSSALSCVFRCPDTGHHASRTGLEMVEKAALPPQRKNIQLIVQNFFWSFALETKGDQKPLTLGQNARIVVLLPSLHF